MAISDNELSVDNSRPIELLQISYTGNFWYYTSADRDVTMGGRVFRSDTPFKHDEITPPTDTNQSGLSVKVSQKADFLNVFRVAPPSEIVSAILMVQNYLVPEEFVVLWRGRIIDVLWEEGGWASVIIENVFSSLNRPGLRRRYSRNCPYALYDSQCRVSRDAWREITPVIGMSGISVITQASPGKPDNYYAGGYMTWANIRTGNIEKRMIRLSNGTTGALTLASHPIGLAGGVLVSLYAGCAHTIEECNDKFDNVENCGATPYIPTKNPFGGSSIF